MSADFQTHNKEFVAMLRWLAEGLKKYTVEELTENLGSLVSDKKLRQRQQKLKVECVLSEICTEFEITRDELVKGRGKGVVQTARKYAYCILHQDVGLPIRYIAKNIFLREWHTSVSVAVNYTKTLNVNIKADREFGEKLQELREKIKEKIKNVL